MSSEVVESVLLYKTPCRNQRPPNYTHGKVKLVPLLIRDELRRKSSVLGPVNSGCLKSPGLFLHRGVR